MTYKKAIRLCVQLLKDHGLQVSKTAQKQLGYLVLYATEGEISKSMHHQLKAKLKDLPCAFTAGSMSDDTFMSYLKIYAEQLEHENPEGGEISLGWLLQECEGEELWAAFAN